jgi:hypothetical protein
MGVLCPIAAQGYDLGARLKLVRLRNLARFWDPGVMLRALQAVDVGPVCVSDEKADGQAGYERKHECDSHISIAPLRRR